MCRCLQSVPRGLNPEAIAVVSRNTSGYPRAYKYFTDSSNEHSLSRSQSTNSLTMKISSAVLIAIACVIGLVTADYGGGYGYVPVSPGYGGGAGGLGSGGLYGLIGLLFLLMILLGNNNNTARTTTPTGGYVFVNVTK